MTCETSRHLRKRLSVICAILAVTFAVLEFVSFWRTAAAAVRVKWSTPHALVGIVVQGGTLSFAYASGEDRLIFRSEPYEAPTIELVHLFLGFGWFVNGNDFAAGAPCWFIALVLAGLTWKLRRGTKAIKGICPMCGYDLRASPDRCPECGTLISAPAFA